ncbi:MAG: hypothetical protein GX362_06520 [Methanosarcinaceae archaeon]|nr:hypothetical protein [Methanosarcinaceae archaeon]
MKFNRFFYLSSLAFLILLCVCSFASAESSSGGAKLTLVEENPYPAQIGQQMRILVQIENIIYTPMNDTVIQVVSEYPFHIDSSQSTRNLGTLYHGKKHYEEFYIMIDESAPKGPRDLIIRQRSGGGNWVETRFTINIGTNVFDSRGTFILENVISDPAVFMPGDKGQISIILKNNATVPTISLNKSEYDTNARIQTADLISTSDISVTSNIKKELGIVSAGDSKVLIFDVSVPEHVSSGTYYLTLKITGNSYEYNFNQDIAIKVDDSGIILIPSKEAKQTVEGTVIEYDVVNYRPNTIRGTIITPEKEGYNFFPPQYFIGEMKTDELYTAKFTAVSKGEKAKGEAETETITVKASYLNGDNPHENKYDFEFSTARNESFVGSWIIYLIVIVLAVILVGAAGYLYYRKKKSDKKDGQ